MLSKALNSKRLLPKLKAKYAGAQLLNSTQVSQLLNGLPRFPIHRVVRRKLVPAASVELGSGLEPEPSGPFTNTDELVSPTTQAKLAKLQKLQKLRDAVSDTLAVSDKSRLQQTAGMGLGSDGTRASEDGSRETESAEEAMEMYESRLQCARRLWAHSIWKHQLMIRQESRAVTMAVSRLREEMRLNGGANPFTVPTLHATVVLCFGPVS